MTTSSTFSEHTRRARARSFLSRSAKGGKYDKMGLLFHGRANRDAAQAARRQLPLERDPDPAITRSWFGGSVSLRPYLRPAVQAAIFVVPLSCVCRDFRCVQPRILVDSVGRLQEG